MKFNIGKSAVAFRKQNREVNRFLSETTLFVALLIGLAVNSQASVMNSGALAKEPQKQSTAQSAQQNSVPSNGVIGTAFSYTWHPEVGKPILHFVRHSVEGARFDSNDSSASLTVLVLLSADSVTTRRTLQTVESLQNQYTGRAVRFVGIAVGVAAKALPAFAHDLTIPVLVDPHGQLAEEFAVGSSPYSCIWDSAGIARYYGPLDDSTDHTPARHHYLRDAMGASLRPSQLTSRRTSAHSHCGV